MKTIKTEYDFGYHVLGPIFYSFSYKLWVNQQVWTDRDSFTLFLSRGGLRLRYVYRLFLEKNDLEAPLPEDDFYVSRMSLLKASYVKTPEKTSILLQREYNSMFVTEAMSCLLPKAVFDSWIACLSLSELEEYKTRTISADYLRSFVMPNHSGYQVLGSYLNSHTQDLRRHLDEIRKENSHVIMVDTGWSGTILRECRDLFPDIKFYGHFFGRSSFSSQVPEHFSCLQGVGFEANKYQWSYPLSSILLHRHLIEGIFEPKWSSVEGYLVDDSQDLVIPENGLIPEHIRKPNPEEQFLKGICDYISKSTLNLNASEIQMKENAAASRLRRFILFPNLKQVKFLTVETRSADFGKDLDVPVLKFDAEVQGISRKLNRIRNSLWPNGQAAIEFSGIMRIFIQAAICYPNISGKLWNKAKKYVLRHAS